MPTEQVLRSIKAISDPFQKEIYMVGAKLLLDSYINSGYPFLALNYDYPGGIRVPFPYHGEAVPRISPAVLASHEDFFAAVPQTKDVERVAFHNHGIAYFPPANDISSFSDRFKSWAGPLSDRGQSALIPPVADDIMDRLFPEQAELLDRAIPEEYKPTVEKRRKDQELHPMLFDGVVRVWATRKPLLTILKGGVFCMFETGLFWEEHEIKLPDPAA